MGEGVRFWKCTSQSFDFVLELSTNEFGWKEQKFVSSDMCSTLTDNSSSAYFWSTSDLPNLLLIADDVVGGTYAINRGTTCFSLAYKYSLVVFNITGELGPDTLGHVYVLIFDST